MMSAPSYGAEKRTPTQGITMAGSRWPPAGQAVDRGYRSISCNESTPVWGNHGMVLTCPLAQACWV
jgi:hypothetical protein